MPGDIREEGMALGLGIFQSLCSFLFAYLADKSWEYNRMTLCTETWKHSRKALAGLPAGVHKVGSCFEVQEGLMLRVQRPHPCSEEESVSMNPGQAQTLSPDNRK